MDIRFIETGGPLTFRPWLSVEQAPAVDDHVDIEVEHAWAGHAWNEGDPQDNQVVARVTRRQWYRDGRAVICYVTTSS